MRLVADANVLLSALIGGRAARVLMHPAVAEVLTTAATFAEVQEYAPVLGARRGLTEDRVLLALAALPVSLVPASSYSMQMREARRRMAHRDPDDVELLALAIETELPIWSNDEDFAEGGVPRYTTAELLKLLGFSKR